MKLILHVLFTLLLFLNYFTTFSQSVIQSNGTGNWNTGSTWVGGIVPSTSDSVVINNTHTVTVDMPGSGNSVCNSLNILNGGIIEFRQSSASTLQISNSLTVASGGILRTASGSLITSHRLEVNGNISVAGSLNINRNTLSMAGDLTGSGTVTADSIYTTIELNGSSSQSINTNFNNSKLGNIKVYNSASITGSLTIMNSALFYSGALTCSGTFTLGNSSTNSFSYTRRNGTHPTVNRNYGTGTNNFIYSGTIAQTTGSELPSSSSTGILTINSTSDTGVTLNAAFDVAQLVMTNGKLTTTNSNMLRITDSNSTAVSRTNGWVNGPMKRVIPYGMVYVERTRIYLFPVGKSTYNGLELVSPTSRNATTFSCNPLKNSDMLVEVFDAASGGSGGSNFTALTSNRYWYLSLTSNSCSYFSSGIRVFDSTSSDTMTMGVSSSKTGTYNNIGGFYYNYTLGGTQPVYPSIYGNTIYICLGGKPDLTGGTYSVGTSGKDYKGLTAVANILHSRIVKGDIVFEVYDNYTSNDEVFPLIFWPFIVRNGDWKVTIRPYSGNSGDILTVGNPDSSTWHASFWPLFTFEGTRNLIIDGRKGGTGSTSSWTFRNSASTGTGPVFQFINDARKDTIQYLKIESQNSNNGGSIHVAGTDYSVGNDSNGIKNNTIQRRTDLSASYYYGIVLNGGTSSPKNDHITIEGNSIVNSRNIYLYVHDSAAGNYLKIKDNHLYNSVSSGQSQYGMDINTKNGPKYFEITGNNIGGSSANCGGTGWTSGTASLSFRGIRLNVDTTESLILNNNKIKNWKLTGNPCNFYGIEITAGKVDITNNEIGDTSTDSSINITSGAEIGAIKGANGAKLNIYRNTIGGFYNKSNTGFYYNYIINLSCYTAPKIEYNTIKKIRYIASSNNNNAIFQYGIYYANSFSITDSIRINHNTIEDLRLSNSGTGASIMQAIYLSLTTNKCMINSNKIFNLKSNSTGSSADLTGIYLNDGNYYLNNNMISVLNSGNTNDISIQPIYSNPTGGRNVFMYNNTLLLGGSVSSGSKDTYTFRRTRGNTVILWNNFIANTRTGGSGTHYAIGNIVGTPTSGWNSTASMHNVIAVGDTSKVALWNATLKSNTSYRVSSSGDSTSWIYTNSEIPIDSIFTNPNTDFTINTGSNYSWLLNGRGKQSNSIYYGDYFDSTTFRSRTVSGGAPDVGAHEFTPASYTLSPNLSVLGSHSTNSTEYFWQGGRKVFELIWANSGTLPTLENYRYYTGKWPNDTNNGYRTSNARYLNAYIRIDTAGSSLGSGYQYGFKLYYDDALLGKINTESSMILTKKRLDMIGTWDSVRTTTRNGFINTIQSSGIKLKSFSEFTATEDNSFVLPIIFTNYSIEKLPNENKFTKLNWEVAQDINVTHYNINAYDKFNNIIFTEQVESQKSSNQKSYEWVTNTDYSCFKIEAMFEETLVDQTNKICKIEHNNLHSINDQLYIYQNVLYIVSNSEQDKIKEIQLVDITGKINKKIELNIQSGTTNRIELDRISSGAYFIRCITDKQEQTFKCIIIH